MANILSTLSPLGDQGTPENGGARYSVFSDWEAAQESLYGDLVGGGNTAELQCYKGTYSTNSDNIINGWIADASHNITIRAAAGEEHGGVWDAGAIIQVTHGFGIAISSFVPFTVVEDVQLQDTVTGNNNATALYAQSASTSLIGKNLLLQCFATAAGSRVFHSKAQSVVLTNTVARNVNNAASNVGFYIDDFIDNEFLTCDAIGSGIGFNRRAGGTAPTLTNCVAYGNTTDYVSDSVGFSGTNNASGDLTASTLGIGTVTGVQADDFVSYPDDLTPEPAGLLAGEAVNLSNDFTDDITGATRQSLPDPWDIGAYKVAGGPPPVGVKEMYVKDGGVFVKYTPYVKVGGTFQEVDAYVKSGGVWVPVHEK